MALVTGPVWAVLPCWSAARVNQLWGSVAWVLVSGGHPGRALCWWMGCFLISVDPCPGGFGSFVSWLVCCTRFPCHQMKKSPPQGRHLLAAARRRPVVWDTRGVAPGGPQPPRTSVLFVKKSGGAGGSGGHRQCAGIPGALAGSLLTRPVQCYFCVFHFTLSPGRCFLKCVTWANTTQCFVIRDIWEVLGLGSELGSCAAGLLRAFKMVTTRQAVFPGV